MKKIDLIVPEIFDVFTFFSMKPIFQLENEDYVMRQPSAASQIFFASPSTSVIICKTLWKLLNNLSESYDFLFSTVPGKGEKLSKILESKTMVIGLVTAEF